MIYGYVQANRMAELSSMSLAAQSYASQGLEQARSAQWNSQGWPHTNGPGTDDEILLFNNAGAANGDATSHTNYLSNRLLGCSVNRNPDLHHELYHRHEHFIVNPPLRQIRSDCVWTFPLDGKLYTNTVITQRAPDQ